MAGSENPQPDFLKQPLNQLSKDEWESICDGCGLCCQHRATHPVTGDDVRTNFACRCLNLETMGCKAYETRAQEVDYCITLTPDTVNDVPFLPDSCGYKLVAAGKPLADWHHLICGDKQAVHRQGISKRGELLPDSELLWWIKNGKKEAQKPAVRFYDISTSKECSE